MSVPRVSVCIRTRDRPVVLREAIASVLAQDFTDLEVVVSSDGEPVDALVASFDDARLRATRNPGPPSATGNLVHAIGQSRGDLIALLDDDDRWEPGFLSGLVPVLDGDPTVGVAFCDYAVVTETTSFPRDWPWASGIQGDLLVRLLDRSIPPAAALLRRTAWEEGEERLPLRPELAGAASIWLRTADLGWRFHHVPRRLTRYRLHGEQMTWTTPTVTARKARTLELLRFDDPAAEHMRLARLTEAHLTQAGIHLRRGEVRRARSEFADARRYGSVRGSRNLIALSGVRRFAARRLSGHPKVLGMVLRVWQRVRPSPG